VLRPQCETDLDLQVVGVLHGQDTRGSAVADARDPVHTPGRKMRPATMMRRGDC
jgi:hypothetical protein